MADLTKEEQDILEKLLEVDARREQIPPLQQQQITNPEKYSFPIGLDDEGRPFKDDGATADDSIPRRETE